MSLFEENAAVLRDIADDGTDLSFPRAIDFAHVFPDQLAADAFAEAAQRAGYATTITQVDRDDDVWDVTAARTMLPSCANITDAEQQLDALARSYRGRADGWGFF